MKSDLTEIDEICDYQEHAPNSKLVERRTSVSLFLPLKTFRPNFVVFVFSGKHLLFSGSDLETLAKREFTSVIRFCLNYTQS